jgi:hypothetical protein
MTNYTLVARVESATDPSRRYDIKTDGVRLTCPCPGWTRQSHAATCRAHQGLPCNCKSVAGERSTRTCRHVRAVLAEAEAHGGLANVIRLARRGVTFDDVVAAQADVTRTADLIQQAVQRLRVRGCERVIISAEGFAATEQVARTQGCGPTIAFIRRDGWTLGAPAKFREVARQQWPDQWVATYDLRTARVTPYADQPAPASRSRRPASAPAQAPAPAPLAAITVTTLDWIGGGRAIILRD